MPIGLPADSDTLRKYSTWFVVYGIVLIVLGGLAIIAPNVATLAVEFMVGWLLVIGGAFGLIAAVSAGRTAPGFWWSLLTAFFCILAGVVLLTRPAAGAITLTIIFTAYLLASGFGHIMLAIGYRNEIPNAWVWMLISGIIDIGLALIIMSGMPGTAAWVLGLFVGINLLMTGVAILMAALAVRRIALTA